MTTQELKNKIEKVLGNSIRCLLPSYWWKNLFHSVADRIDEVEATVSDMVVKSLKEFEAKHPDMASNTLVFTGDSSSAEARGNVIKTLQWVNKMENSPAKTAVNPLYIAVPLVDEEFAYSIQTPMYGLGEIGVIFYDVRMPDGQSYNIEFNLISGVASRELASSGDLITFAAPINGTLTEEAKQINRDSYKTLEESYNLFLATGEVPTYNVNVLYLIVSCYAQIVTPPIITTSGIAILFTNPSGFRQRLIVKSDGSATVEEFISEADASLILLAYSPEYGELGDDDKKANQLSYYRFMGYQGFKDTKIQYQISNDEALIYSVTSATGVDDGLRLTAADAGKAFILTSDGNITVAEHTSSGGVEIRELHISQLSQNGQIAQETQLTDEQKAWNLETIELVKRKNTIAAVNINGVSILLQVHTERPAALWGSFGDDDEDFALVVFYDAQGNTNVDFSLRKPIDFEMSDTSKNAVQNKVVYSELQKKQDTISDLADIRSGAALGKTALQSVPSEYITENELNNAIASAITTTLNTEV